MVLSIQLKFGMYIISHRRTNSINFDEYRIQLMESSSLKCASIQMVHSIELKFGMYIISHRPTYFVEFGEFRINSFFTGAQKRILIHYSLWSQIVRNMLVSKWCFRLRSNLICSL